MLGGGSFTVQSKTLPGSYVNFVGTSTVGSSVSERGSVAIALNLGLADNVGKVITLTKDDFNTKCKDLLGVEYTSTDVAPLREIFCNASVVYLYHLGDDKTVNDALNTLESYEFNVLCAYTDTDVAAYISKVKSWRDELGKKCQVVVYSTAADYEGVINVVSEVTDEDAYKYTLVAWVAGAEAGCKLGESCTNKLYNGEYNINVVKTQEELENHINNGEVVFHLVYGDVRLLEDINSLKTTNDTKSDDFKSNQTIRVIDQIANDIAKLFNTRYLGKVPNNSSGRALLWADIEAHHQELVATQAIEAFDSTKLTIEQGKTKKSIVVHDSIVPVNAMAQLYMTVVIQ